MPEGPEIRRVSDALNQAIAGRQLTDVWFAFDHLQAERPRLLGAEVLRIEPRGKALLTHFSSGLTLYSHNQLYGRWVTARPGELPPSARTPRVRLATAAATAVLYSASDIELWPIAEIESHPFLQRIGPDVLSDGLDAQTVLARLRQPDFARRRLGALLLDQAFLAGLGNYLRAEILWSARLSPERRPADLPAEALAALAGAIVDVPWLSYATRGAIENVLHHDAAFEFHVFKREGAACTRCGTTIRRIADASRPLYFCPACQA